MKLEQTLIDDVREYEGSGSCYKCVNQNNSGERKLVEHGTISLYLIHFKYNQKQTNDKGFLS